MSASLRSHAISGVKWTALRSVLINLLRMLFSVILARILEPTAFGYMSMVVIVRNLVALLRDAGFSSAVVVYEDLEGPKLSSLFWMNFLLNIGLYAGACAIAPVLSWWFSEDIVVPLIRVSLLGFLIDSLGVLNFSLLRRELKFQSIFWGSLAGEVVYGLVAIPLALFDYGVWSLVWGDLCMRAAGVIFFWIKKPFRLHFRLRIREVRPVFRYSVNILGGNLLNYLKGNIDSFFIGRFMGPEILGYYSLALRVSVRPITELGIIIYDSFLPIFARLHPEKMRNVYVELLQLVSLIGFIGFWMVFLFIPQLVEHVFGTQWIPAIPFFLVRVFIGPFMMIAATYRTVFYAHKRPELLNYAMLLYIPLAALGFYWSSISGVSTLLWMIVLLGVLENILLLGSLSILLSLSMKEIGKVWGRGLVYGGMLLLIGIGLQQMMPNSSPLIVLGVTLMVLVFGLYLDRKFWKELLQKIKH